VLDGVVIGGVEIIDMLDEAETGVGSSSFVVLDGKINGGASPIAVPTEWLIPIPAAIKSPTLLGLISTFGEESFSVELMIDGVRAEAREKAVGETNAAVELTQGPLVSCARLVDISSESARTNVQLWYL